MKRILHYLVLLSFCFSSNVGFTQARWVGAMSDDWFDPENWEWTDGSYGVPNSETTDIIFDLPMSELIYNSPWVRDSNVTVRVNNITAADTAFAYIRLSGRSTFEIYGSVVGMGDRLEIAGLVSFEWPETWYPQKIILKGSGDQQLQNTVIRTSSFIIDKAAGDVFMKGRLEIDDSLVFRDDPVEIGFAPTGNLVVRDSSIILYRNAKIIIPKYTDSQTPPHIVTKQGSAKLSIDDRTHGIEWWRRLTDTVKYCPIGYSTFSYNPVTIFLPDTGIYRLSISVKDETLGMCDLDMMHHDSAVNLTWNIVNDASGIVDTILLDLQFEFNKQNFGYEVASGFTPSHDMKLINKFRNSQPCVTYDPLVNIDSNYVKLKVFDQNKLRRYVAFNPNVVDTPTNVDDLNESHFKIYPNPAYDYVTIELPAERAVSYSVFDVLGRTVIEETFFDQDKEFSKNITVKSLPPGTYIIRIKGKDAYTTSRFSKL